MQIIPEKDAWNYPPAFDVTKVWCKKEYPLIEVGVLELNKNPVDFFAEVEQVAFSPGNFVPGISLSPDRVLQGRVFAYVRHPPSNALDSPSANRKRPRDTALA